MRHLFWMAASVVALFFPASPAPPSVAALAKSYNALTAAGASPSAKALRLEISGEQEAYVYLVPLGKARSVLDLGLMNTHWDATSWCARRATTSGGQLAPAAARE